MPSVPDTIPLNDQNLIKELLSAKPSEFTELTQTQYEAFEDGALDEGNHLVVAETGNGKTFIAEAVTKKALQTGDNVAYLVPSVALVGDKYETLTAWIPERYTVRRGGGYREADVIIATFESFFEAILRGYADKFDTVVLDDFHEIYSGTRGPNIEKGITAALDHNQEILGISATIGNPHVIARWLNARLTISTEPRAVPIIEEPIEKTNEPYATQIARTIKNNRDKGPFLVFNDTTSNAESRANGVADTTSFEVDSDIDFKAEISDQISTELTDSHLELIHLLKNGIAYHHSRLEPGVKDLIEAYTEEGVIKCVFSTTTLSYGFDSPVQSVIVADLKRWDGFGQFIGVYEYIQWIGRAGRDPSIYDEAYAFALWNDEEAFDKFQFDTRVEDKDLEDVQTHLSGQVALRWVILELVTYGWETDKEVLDFIKSTLFWSDTVDQIPQHIQDDYKVQPGEDIIRELQEHFSWIERHGLISKPLGQPSTEETRYQSTDLGRAVVEYEHSNWFDNSVSSVLQLADTLHEEGQEITPERLVERLAEEYFHCDLTFVLEGEGPVGRKMELHGLTGTEGTTAAIVCWLWCGGVPITDIEDFLQANDLTDLVNVTGNLSSAIDSTRHLYDPFDMPNEPEWLELFAEQVDAGVPGPDMYLVNNANYFGRVLYNRLADRLDRIGAGTDWDPGNEFYVIERLSKLLAERDQELFRESLKSTNGIGNAISQNILECLLEWDPNAEEMVEVPFSESFSGRHGSDQVTRFHQSSDPLETKTTLDDF